jgi:hypothetical protein
MKMFSLIGLLLLIGSIQVTESQRSSSTTMDGKALLLTAEQNCSAQYTVSSTCKNHLSSSAESMQIIVKFNNSAYNQQNLDQILGDLCNSCGTDFGNIVPLNVDQQSSFVCSSLIYVYNTLPVMCKKNDQGKYCVQLFYAFQTINPATTTQAQRCAAVDCCIYEMIKLIVPTSLYTSTVNTLQQQCNYSSRQANVLC